MSVHYSTVKNGLIELRALKKLNYKSFLFQKSPGFGAGVRTGKGMIWTPAQNKSAR